jgi:protein involved in polysaccharide export with SLBB domain
LLVFALWLWLVFAPPVAAQTDSERRSTDAGSSAGSSVVNEPGATGPVRLREPTLQPSAATRSRIGSRPQEDLLDAPPAPPSEFEEYVNRLAGNPPLLMGPGLGTGNGAAPGAGDRTAAAPMPGATAVPRIRRLGADLMTQPARGDGIDYNPLVPPDYVVAAGDEIVLTIWGSVDADLRLFVDRSGRITVPRVGAIMVSGVRYAELPAVISRRVGQTFRNFELSVSLGQLRGVRVFVTGFVARPGAYTMNALSSLANAVVRAGGPSASGSFRHITLRRGGTEVGTLDFYDLLLKGDRSGDRLLQAEDVVHVGPIGPQVAAIGSVNRPAIFELRQSETLADVLRMAGGTSPVAATSRFAVERMDERSTVRVVEVELASAAATEMRNGDVVRVFNAVTVAAPQLRQNKRVRVEGEVLQPGDYVLPPQSTIADALRAAGGFTPGAFVFGTDFTRESVRLTQQENYDRALRNLETEITLASATQRVASADEAAAQAGRAAGTRQLIERLRAIRPTGRVVLQIPPDSRELPNLVLEDGDRLLVPPVPTSVGVFGSVFNAGSYLRENDRTLADYLRLAGGPTKGADESSTFVLRANGTVVSNLQSRRVFGGISSTFEQTPALPGDTLFVPEELDKTTLVQNVKDWTQILAQFALGVAAFVTLTD